MMGVSARNSERDRINCVSNRRGRHAPQSVRASLCLLAAVLAVACGDSGPTSPPPTTTPPGSEPAGVASVTIAASSPEVAVAGQLQLQATVRDGSDNDLAGRQVTWASSDLAMASVDASGIVSGIKLGSVAVTATAEGVSSEITIDVRGFLIGPSGGEAVSADGRASARVPADALDGSVVITVEPAKSTDLPQNDEAFIPRSAYEFGPSGQQFSAPVKLAIRYDRARVPANILESSLRLGRAEGGFWTHVTGGSVDMLADDVYGEVTGFSIYGAIGVPRDLRPTAIITAPADGSSFASGTSVTFTGTGTDPEDGALSGASLVWTSNLDGQFGTSGSVTTSGLSIGLHTIRFRVTDSDGLTDTDVISVTITNNLPTAAITAPADGSSFAAGTSVAFTGTGTDPDDGALSGASLVWTSDLDGQFGTSGSVTTTGLSIGVHTISLTVTDSNGGTDTDQITVTITNNLPTATITGPADGTSKAVAHLFTFTGTGTDPEDGALSGASLAWTSDLDGAFGTGESVPESGLSVGVHTITLTVADANGGTDTDQITVTVTLTPPSAWINEPADGSSFFVGTAVTFRGGGSAAQASLSWTSDLDGQFGTGSQVTTSALSIGIHTITWAVTTAGGTGTDQITVTILNNDPTAAITAPADGSSFASGTSVAFTGTGTDPEDGALSGASLVWTSDLDGQFGTSGSVTTSGLSIGVHAITLTVTDSNGGTDTDQITVTIT